MEHWHKSNLFLSHQWSHRSYKKNFAVSQSPKNDVLVEGSDTFCLENADVLILKKGR